MKENLGNISFTTNIEQEISKLTKSYTEKKFYILSDKNVKKHCIDKYLPSLAAYPCMILPSGEKNKSTKRLLQTIDFLIDNQADKNSILLNIGGGVITDLGGFAASVYKRGIQFINIPTSLMAQTDASAGGKTGINYRGLKNEIGIINNAFKVILFSDFLGTLPEKEFKSGFAEMLKHGFITDKKYLDELFAFYESRKKGKNDALFQELIKNSIKIKHTFVKNDLHDKKTRKILNFGHTFGHAIESMINNTGQQTISHGEAVAHGIVLELFLSNKKLEFSLKDFLHYTEKILNIYNKINFTREEIDQIGEYMAHDKKNVQKKTMCILLKNVGEAQINNEISEEEIRSALNFYLQLSK